ncbi:MAG: ABC transporter permease [Mucilaginibacter polytrichastri]|nr:ABC transporter permease [Mucilaginibacter polytrichastri]
MLKNYLKIAWRNLLRNRVFSLINVAGLAIGMAAFILIGTWIADELQYDRFHENGPTLYKVYNRIKGADNTSVFDITSGPLAKSLKTEFPEVKYASRIYWSIDHLFSFGDKSLKAKGNEVDKDFLKMFSFPLIKGNKEHALDQVRGIILTETLARKLFGDEDPINKLVKLDTRDSYTVTGVMKDLPGNTTFDFEYLTSLEANQANYGGAEWGNNTFYTYVQLQPNASAEKVNRKIRDQIRRHVTDANMEIFLYPISKWHLYSRFENGEAVGGKIEIVRLLLIVASLILGIACINFMNLSTAQGQKRAREVGVRKVIGASKASLIRQFLAESVLIAFFAGILALLVVQCCLPYFNEFTGKKMHIAYGQPLFWLAAISCILITGLLAGSYPAFFLSAFRPVTVLKGKFLVVKQAVNPRKALVVIQFCIAIVLIICTLVIVRQIRHVQDRDTGYSINNLVEVPVEGDIEKNYDLIKQELLSKGVITAMSRTGWSVTLDAAQSAGYSWAGMDESMKKRSYSRFVTTGDFVKTMGLKLVEGRDIDIDRYPGDTASMLLNTTALREMNIKDPVGKTIDWNGQKITIVGVFRDFIIGSPYEHVNAMLLMSRKSWMLNTVLRFNPANGMAKNMRIAGEVFKKYNPSYPFTYNFVDQEYAKKFSDQQQTASLAGLFAGLTIFISCMGLFGLAMHTAANRIKEIGVRKVLGASVLSITNMLTSEFVLLVVIAIFIAVPVSWYLMHKWLLDFTYRITLGFSPFLLAGCMAVLIAVFTISFQAVKAALANPVKSLRSE